MTGKTLDLTNKKFGKLLAVEPVKIDNKRGWRYKSDYSEEDFLNIIRNIAVHMKLT